MVTAQVTNSNSDRLVAGVVTSVFLLSAYFLLNWAGLPELKRKTDVYEEINWSRFQPKQEKLSPQPEPAAPTKVEEALVIEPVLQPAKVQPAQKIDLSALKSQFSGLNQQPQAPPPGPQAPGKNAAKMKVELDKASMLAGLNTLLGDSSDRLRLPDNKRRGRPNGKTKVLTAATGSGLEASVSDQYSAGGTALAAPEGKDPAVVAPQIAMVSVSQTGERFADLSPLYHPLLDWMKRNGSRLPDVVNRFMETTPGDLTAAVQFQIEGREFDMFLVCKENLNEIRLCLVENDRSTYLIDRGFKERSSFLRSGGVNRLPGGQILSFGTTREAASDHRTTEFYQIFLSWWETVK